MANISVVFLAIPICVSVQEPIFNDLINGLDDVIKSKFSEHEKLVEIFNTRKI